MSSSDIFIETRNVSLSFPLPPGVKGKSQVGGTIVGEGHTRQLLALDNVSFRLEAGDSLGLVGHNGSGKTTLLRVLSGIFLPSGGSVISKGRVGNALNTNLGFRPEATGRRNIELKAIVAGCPRKQIPSIIDDVEDFAELGPFLDVPMHTYSAGMRARLAFGVATAFHYDILILDEWLGAGDKSMQDKATARMQSFVKNASITVIASHSEILLKTVCNKGLCLKSGKQMMFGDLQDVLDFQNGQQPKD